MTAKQQVAIAMHPVLQYGLGDVFRTMYRKGGWFGKLKDASNTCDITILLCSHNQFTGQIFKYFDYLNVLNVPWPHRTPDFRGIATRHNCTYVKQGFFKKYQFSEVKMELNKEEQKEFDNITKKPVIVVHPFAGSPSRMPLAVNKFNNIIHNLRQATDSNIVIVGGTYVRGKRLKAIKHRKVREQLKLPNIKGVWNLVNRTTPRLPAKLVEHAQCFIGNWSAYSCVAWEKRTPVVLLTGPGAYNQFSKKNRSKDWSYRWHDKCIAVQVRNKPILKVKDEVIQAYLKVTKEK